jgi:pSer/pThr/pTyr-binding forkhead associated (FHA) protein
MKKIVCTNTSCGTPFFFDTQRNPKAVKVMCPKCRTIIPLDFQPPPLPIIHEDEDNVIQQPRKIEVPILALKAGQSVFPLRQGSNFIGRRADNDIVLGQDEHISRRHALLEVIEKPNGGWLYILSDLQSGNGVYVESQRLRTNERIELVAGNTFTLGDTYLRLTR